MKVTMEQFINPITEFFKTANKSVVYIEFSLFGTLFIVAAIFLYLFFNKKKKIETEEDCQKEKNEEKKLENKKNQKSPKLINKYLDLHLHLDGAITKEIARELADIQGIPIETDEEKLENLH